MPLSEKQKIFVKNFRSLDPKYLYMLYGGGVRGGKSILLIGLIHQLAIDYPGTRYAIIRKNLTTLKRTSLPSFKKVLEINGDEKLVSFNMADYVAKYSNGSEVLFIEADKSKDQDFNKIKGLELTIALIEEANEVDESVFSLIITRVGQWKNIEYNIPPKILLNCNPANNWVKRIFYNPWVEGKIKPPFYFLQALPHDNPFITKEYLDSLENLPDNEYQRYVKGNWEFSDDPNQLIQYQWIKNVMDESLENWTYNFRESRVDCLGGDIARYGDDLTVLTHFSESNIVRFEEHAKKNTSEVAQIISLRKEEFDLEDYKIAVDVIGLGAGTVDSLSEYHSINCTAFNSSSSPDSVPNKYNTFKNLRAQAYWEFREDVRLGRIAIIPNEKFVQECTAIQYNIDNKVIQIESKEAFKKRFGRSPDLLDSAVMGNWARKKLLSSTKVFDDHDVPGTFASEMSY